MKSLLQNQLIMVGMWKGSGFDSIIIPRIDRYSGSANISIGNHPNEYSKVFTSTHAAFVKEVMDKTIRQYKFFETPQFLAVKHNIELLNTYKTENVPYFKYFSESCHPPNQSWRVQERCFVRIWRLHAME